MATWSGSARTRAYYRALGPSFPIPGIRFRHFRFRLEGGFRKVRRHLRDGPGLRDELARLNPLDAYYTTSLFLSPERLGPKALRTSLFLYGDLVFDLDVSEELPDLEAVRRETLKLLGFLRERGIAPRYVAFSGSKGFHVVCDGERIGEPDPERRERAYQEAHRAMAEGVAEAGIAIDARTTVDTRRIIRIPGTVNSRTGRVCTVLSERELERPAGEILKSVTRVYRIAPKIPLWGDDRTISWFRTILGWLHRRGARSPPTFLISLVSSRVPGTELTVLILRHPRSRRLRERLEEAQRVYRLPDFYVFSHEGSLYSVCLKPLSRERALKVHKATGSQALGQLARCSLTYMPVGRKRDEGMRVLAPEPVLEQVVPSPHRCRLGRAHARFLAGLGVPVDLERAVVGGGELVIRRCVCSTGPGR